MGIIDTHCHLNDGGMTQMLQQLYKTRAAVLSS